VDCLAWHLEQLNLRWLHALQWKQGATTASSGYYCVRDPSHVLPGLSVYDGTALITLIIKFKTSLSKLLLINNKELGVLGFWGFGVLGSSRRRNTGLFSYKEGIEGRGGVNDPLQEDEK